ncbi:MAG: hypothetical protein GY749_45005, partial [Desulfobacteraceae bacterium]|nr:hypothetical protein [Desulfobacteraceae bacterium]
IVDWKVNEQGGIEIIGNTGEVVTFGFEFVRDVKHTFEFFWNKYRVGRGQSDQVKLGSTHGRPIVSLTTLSGEVAATPDMDVLGITEVRDIDGSTVHVGGKLAPRTTRAEQLPVPPINREVKPHWHKVVLHQGWLLKQGGIGVGASKSWIKRYFVLYKTSQGHFLTYYADFTECPLYSTEKNHRNFVDLAKCCFIRPGSNKQDNPDTPAQHWIDFVTKPFQCNRPNLSPLASGKLPPLRVMREMALELRSGDYKPCPPGNSRRVDIAFQHIYEGSNCFFLRSLAGPKPVASQWRSDSTLTFADDSLVFRPRGTAMDTKIEFGFWDIVDWIVNEQGGIEIIGNTGEVVTFGFEFVRDVKHTFEFFWNKYRVGRGQSDQVKLGSTHGRPIVSLTTLSGEVAATP